MRYRYEITGTATDAQTWTTTGEVETETDKAGDFPGVPHAALGKSFLQLTRGEAVYGHPGLGCNGPYGITRMMIERVGEESDGEQTDSRADR
jgi:hypothetical protein